MEVIDQVFGEFVRDMGQIVQHPYVLFILVVALAFDFINGFHDAANSIATVVGDRKSVV